MKKDKKPRFECWIRNYYKNISATTIKTMPEFGHVKSIKSKSIYIEWLGFCLHMRWNSLND